MPGFHYHVIVEIEAGRPDPVRLVAVHSEESMPGRLSIGRGEWVRFDRHATQDSIQRELERCY
jgi:hypothetical protein